MSATAARPLHKEWPTLVLLVSVYALWLALTFYSATLGLALTIPVLAVLIAQHSSIQHETLHIIEPRWPIIGLAIVFPAIGLYIPYIRFRDAHLEHHKNENLTDPYDDPESFYLCAEIWHKLPTLVRLALHANNTLLGRMVLGPLVGQIAFMASDFRAIVRGDRKVLRAWLVHIPAVAVVLWWLIAVSTMPLWAYLLSAYVGLSLLKIRTFLEHRAHETENGRSVIVEDRGPLAFLFLNNNFHAAHHAHPSVPWYDLPKLYRTQRQKFLTHNLDYRYRSYKGVFRAYFLRIKEPVEHPLWTLKNRNTPTDKTQP